uniref:Ion transport domain-containing protein n=1 Tax=Eutreptiella gymnastica TaxID=73025 RepID=A0A7S1NQQ4_9EUGL|mmetsp:Transcript_73481/g.129507  ORF Transcript_73481/g.129507 Transcript_73481/m.129507 type:complete len:317 (+) Transcript_73481:123-1073(+)
MPIANLMMLQVGERQDIWDDAEGDQPDDRDASPRCHLDPHYPDHHSHSDPPSAGTSPGTDLHRHPSALGRTRVSLVSPDPPRSPVGDGANSGQGRDRKNGSTQSYTQKPLGMKAAVNANKAVLRVKRQVDAKTDAKSHWFILLPDSRARTVWDMLQVIILLYVSVSVPIRVCMEAPAMGGWYVLDLFVDLYFYIDILLNCITGYYNRTILILNLSMIMKRYVKSWLLVDILSIMPIDMALRVAQGTFVCSFDVSCPDVMPEQGGTGQLFRLFKVLRLIRLVKLLRILRIGRMFEAHQQKLIQFEGVLPIIKHVPPR